MAVSGRLHHQITAGKKGAPGEMQATGSSPVDRGKAGSKRHLLTDAKGIPLAVVLSGANRHDMKKLAELLDAVVIPRPTQEQQLCLDRGYDADACREAALARGYVTHIPHHNAPLPAPDDPKRHPPRRWVVEVSHSWFNRFRRLLVRWEKLAQHYLAFVQLAACLIICRKLL